MPCVIEIGIIYVYTHCEEEKYEARKYGFWIFLKKYLFKNPLNNFLQLFQMQFHIVVSHIPKSIVPVLDDFKFLTSIKFFKGIRLIAMGEVQ
jgi:hypothetical protein